jgi:hypothetical protein
MAGLPAVRGQAFEFYIGLTSQANAHILQANPTLAAGDAQISKDGGAFANLATLPAVTPALGRAVRVQLSATEMTADNIVVIFCDAAGTEWDDRFILIQTAEGYLANSGGGANAWTYTLTSTVLPNPPIADADVWVTTDIAGTNVVASGKTDAAGVVTFYLDAGQIFVWRQKSGWNFVNPDTENVP